MLKDTTNIFRIKMLQGTGNRLNGYESLILFTGPRFGFKHPR